MLSVANYLKKPRRGEPPPSDVDPAAPAVVGSGIVRCLRVKGFCVINHAVSESMVASASAELPDKEWYQPAVLIQEGLLGVEGSNRIARMASVDFDRADAPQDGLAGIDFAMWKLAEAIGPFQDELGFRCCGRSIGFLHQACDPDLEEAELTDQEASDWSAIFTSRKILILVFLGPGKGTLEMQPYDDEANVSEITTVPGLVVVLRTDQLSFKFFCRGREATHVASSFMLQNDILRMHRNRLEAHLTPAAQELDQWIDQRLREIKEMEPEEPTEDWSKSDVPRSFIHAANRTWFKRQTTIVRGVAARLPVTWETEVFFLGLTSGADTCIEVPIMRWEHDTVYDPSPDCWKRDPPMTNCRHASFIDGVDLFDNKLFGLSLAETKGMDPGQRLVLEVTYDALYRSGMKKSSLINSTVGMYVGTSQSEWNFAEKAADVGIFGATGGAPSITAGRLSFCLGCKGASLAIDTDAASGLSAVFWAAESVEKKGQGHIQEASCGIGVHLCLAKAWWPAHSAAGFLCPGGRCFTFDSSAQGHVRSEGVGTVVVKCQEKMEAEAKDDVPSVGTLVGGATQNSGKSAGMSAPNGPAEQAVLVEACRKSGIMALDVDVVECHGSGRFIADAVEAASCGRALRDGAESEDAEMLQLCSMKTNIGNAIETSGIASMIKTLHSIRWGIVCANNHLNQLNPHLDLSSCPLLMCTEPTEQKLSAVFMGVSAWGFGGTNVHIHCYGGVDEEIRLPPEPTPQELRPRLSYWPSGGGDLGSMSRPRRGFFIIGSWSGWTQPEPMEDEGDGCYGFTLAVGDTRWEQFQLLIDNNYAKVLHPQRYKAPKGTEVFGPTRTEEVMQDSTWFLDGRPFTAQIRAIADQGSSALAEKEPMEYKNEDEGMPGQQYRIRLHIAGKWRTVTWTKLQAPGPGQLALKGPEAKYYVAGSWNNFRFEAMAPEREGTFACQVSLSGGPNRFQLVRNGDWHQSIFPATANADPSAEIEGPTDRRDRYWLVSGTSGQSLKIIFTRTVDAEGKSKMRVSWEKL
ncbi:unnamed protein product [Effrenium voratum]|uniref:Ketosynthase family 3 (KS3) domain-containing protein n=1 Tax=Effrenium voratum TaxID=2562239 RepID=A0AA36JAE8_9DINO|nr:unnamed protein product [Effrenium voratum]